jgi:hypothetical protein
MREARTFHEGRVSMRIGLRAHDFGKLMKYLASTYAAV